MFFVYKRLGTVNMRWSSRMWRGRLRVTATVTGIKYD